MTSAAVDLSAPAKVGNRETKSLLCQLLPMSKCRLRPKTGQSVDSFQCRLSVLFNYFRLNPFIFDLADSKVSVVFNNDVKQRSVDQYSSSYSNDVKNDQV